MKKGLLLFALISFLFVGTTNVYAQDDLKNQIDIELSDNNISDDVEDKKKDEKIKKIKAKISQKKQGKQGKQEKQGRKLQIK